MGKYNLTNKDFLDSLKEQLYFLTSSLSNFSNNEIEAKRVATTIRLLVHDTNNSVSLLKYLKRKELIEFINSSSPNDNRLHSMTGMKNVTSANTNQYIGLVAKINNTGKLMAVPLFQQHLPKWYTDYTRLSFEDWWNMEIMKINDISLNRKELVLGLVNKDGGAHIDGALPEEYILVRSSKLILNIGEKATEFERNIVYASVAQIGWELMKSIENLIPSNNSCQSEPAADDTQ